jgi:hypothetical protein
VDGEADVTVTLRDDGNVRSCNYARLKLGIPLPPER